MIQSIELSPEQAVHYNNVLKLAADIEKEMSTTISSDNASEVMQQLSLLLPYLSNTPLMLATAKAVHEWAKGQAAIEAMENEKIYQAKADIQRKWFSGKLAKYEAFYIRVETIEKALRQQIEGLRSIISFQKQMVNLEKLGA